MDQFCFIFVVALLLKYFFIKGLKFYSQKIKVVDKFLATEWQIVSKSQLVSVADIPGRGMSSFQIH